MDSIQDEGTQNGDPWEFVPEQADGDGLRSYTIFGLASDENTTPTGMREDILLLSWLIVLLRTRDASEVGFDWSYKHQANGSEQEQLHSCLSMEGISTGLQGTASQAATAISHHIRKIVSSQYEALPRPTSLLLSTKTLSQSSGEVRDEDVLHLEATFDDGRLEIRPVWYTETMLQRTVTRYIESLVDTIRICLSNLDVSIDDCIRPTTRDLDEIWGWNHTLPQSYNFCMHDVISEQARRSPNKVAISAWDGDLTYAQIDQYSTHVASSLRDMGVKLHDALGVCFEKSRWTVVAVLAVMKAGATLVLMDPTLPLARLQNMAKQVGANTIVTSRKQHDLANAIIPDGQFIIVEEDAFKRISIPESTPQLPIVPPTALMYIIFTSGSTGTPKGVTISHETYTSSAIPRAKAVGYTEDSRVLDFAAYAFDVSIDSMLLTLGKGGCLCIPSDEDRMNDINAVIRNMQVNYAGITPSVARLLDPDVILSLSALGLGGEAASARDVNHWGRETRIVIGYGPCECTIGCTINSSAATGRDYISIGEGNGAAMWIVDPNDHDSLLPVGAVGELLVEGPIVGQGYLNDPEKTAAAFIKDPRWLTAGHEGYNGRRGRLYKTGDLGRFDPDGSGGIVFVGRKDTQVKLRGQRVELGEIESQLKARLPSETNVIAEVITPSGSGGQPTLVAFLAAQSTKGHGNTEISLEILKGEISEKLSTADADLATVLPRYMIPTAYIPVNYIPVLISGKTDRKQLRQFGSTVDLRELSQGKPSTSTWKPSDLELRLLQAWSQVLKLDVETIRPDDNFFALGGDSLLAMKLVSVCRAEGLDLTVTGAFGNPTFSTMAGVVQICDSQVQTDIPAFSMISQDADSARIEASEACGSSTDAVEDIYPCTPTQESLFTFSLKSIKLYVAQRVACVPSHFGVEAYKKAWEDVVEAHPILRSRLAQLSERGLQQVVLRQKISWRHSTDLSRYLDDDRNERMELGQCLARYAIINNADDGKQYMVWTVHHVLYDGWSEPLILHQVNNALQERNIEIHAQMRDFVKYVQDTDEVAMQEFWQRELKGAVGPQFPRLPSRDFLPTPDAMLEHHVPLETGAGSAFTMATLIRSAWALVAAQYSRSDDVVFGETLTGRDVPLSGVEGIVGPLIATVPVRIRIDRAGSIEAYLRTVQQSMLARTPYQHMGMQNIRKVSQDAQHACEAPTGLVIQPDPENLASELGFEQGDIVREALHFNPYPLMVGCGITKTGFRVCANFDSTLIDITQMKRVLAQLEFTCLQLTKDLSAKVGTISCIPGAEVDQIWQWNQIAPLTLDKSLARLQADSSVKQGCIYPPAIATWVCDPRNPSLLSPIGCVGELCLEGAILSGEIIDPPAWLVAGSSACVGRTGKLQLTGDVVQLREDGSLVFVGRKENVLPAQGHAVDITELEGHFKRYLPPTVHAAAAVFKPLSDHNQQKPEQELVVFIEQQSSEKDSVELMSAEYNITSDATSPPSFGVTIAAEGSISIVMALKRLDKFIHDSLPPYMAPSAYVVVDRMPTATGQVDHDLLNQLASRIPKSVLAKLQEGFKQAWTRNLGQASLTDTEEILQSSWAQILRMEPEKIDIDDNFFRLGGDSVLAMKLVSNLREQGHLLTVADIFQNMRLCDAAKVLKLGLVTREKAKPYKPFSTLEYSNIEPFLSEIVRPKLSNSQYAIRDACPVTDSQALDIKGTIQAPRTSIQYTMLYLNDGIDREQLLHSCEELIKNHDILRTVFIEHKSNFFQVVMDELYAAIETRRADTDLVQYANNLCKSDIESDFALGSPFFKIFYVEGDNNQGCLVIRLSHSQYDGISLPKLLLDLETLYKGNTLVDTRPFSSYIARIRDERTQSRSIEYWRNLLHGSSLSVLDGTSAQPEDKSVFHERPVDVSGRPVEITTANLLTAAWALVLARRLQKSDVTFGNITSGRNIEGLDVEDVMGPCYQFTPVRVSFGSRWTAIDLLQSVQKQIAESTAHDFLGFDKLSKQCTQWSPDVRFFDSIVHHQDFIEEFETMPFAGRTARVEISNPHGDAAYPLKAVSFIRDGQTHVGVVGSEKDTTLVDAILDELVASIQELATQQPERVLLAEPEF